MNFVIYFLLTYGLPIWQGSFSYKDVVACFGNLLVLQGSLMGCNIVSNSGKDSLMFQNPFLTRISYSSYTRKEWLVVFNDILVSWKETKFAGIKEGDFLH
jgi:hypothetical protein